MKNGMYGYIVGFVQLGVDILRQKIIKNVKTILRNEVTFNCQATVHVYIFANTFEGFKINSDSKTWKVEKFKFQRDKQAP